MRKAAAFLTLLAAIVVVVVTSGCGDKGNRTEVRTTADVQDEFADQGLDLAAYEVGPGIPALGYPVGTEGGPAMRISCEIYGDSLTARGVVKTIREKRPGNVSRALRAKNVVVLVDPAATADEVEETFSAVAELRRS